ncbi:reverse transcriptase domain-containing protein, partial [Tanacetum coccineum]
SERISENCSAVILKKLPEKLGDPGKFLILCDFNELKCKALSDLGIARDVFVPVGKFTFPADFVIVDYESDPRVPLILGRPFLRTTRALIDVHGEEMILRDGDERLTLNMRHDTSNYSNQPHKESINMIDFCNVSYDDYLEDLFATNHLSGNPTPISDPIVSSSPTLTSLEESDLIWEEFEAYLASDSFPSGSDDTDFDPEGDLRLIKELLNNDPSSPLPLSHNPLSGSTTSSSLDHLLEEFANELALITFPSGNDDLPFDIESDLREIEYLLKKIRLILLITIFLIPLLRCSPMNMLLIIHPHQYKMIIMMTFLILRPLMIIPYIILYSKRKKIKESKILIDELDPPGSKDKVFNSGILIHENLFEVTNCATPNKNVKKLTNTSLILEDFKPPFYELHFHKEVLGLGALLLFSSKNEEKVFNPGIITSKRVHTSLLPKLPHWGSKAFKDIKIFESPMEIFPCSYGEDIRILDVPCLHFYPPCPLNIGMGQDMPKTSASWIAQIFEASRARGFVIRSQELHILSFIWESDIQILSTNVYL